MYKLDAIDWNATRISVPARCAGLALALVAGTTASVAQDAGLNRFEDDYAAEEVFIEDFDSEELLPEFEPAPGEDAPTTTGDLNYDVSVSEYDLVDLHVNDEDLGRVLQLLSIQSERNIIASQSVDAAVTADLYGVTFYEALDAILHVNGFGYIERGNFIYVYTREELEAIEQAARARESKVIHLNYLNAIDAAEFAAQLLSDGGAITTNAETETFPTSGDSPVGADTYASGATLVIYDYPENIEAVESLITEIDQRPVQVLVEATILQTTLNEANAFGVDFAILNDLDFSDFVGIGGALSVVDGLIAGEGETVSGTAVDLNGDNGAAINTNIGNVAGPSTFKAGIVNEDVAVFMRVLDQVTDVTVVSNPKILTLNRQAARVLVGTKVGYLNTTTTETATTQTVEFLDTGTQLSVRPFVSDAGVIRLELKPQVSSAQLREVADNSGNTVTIPDEDTTELTTNVQLRDGQTAVLGGLFTETTTATRRQVPVLGDIPLIGNAFRGHDDSTRRNEIIFLVTPSIVNDTMVSEAGELGNTYLRNATLGAREGTLFWSRERRVSRLLIEARKHADEGNLDMAIFKVQKAIGLNPTSSDARTMLEHLTNETRRRPTRSILEGAINRDMLDPMPGVTVDGRWHRPNFIAKPSTDAGETRSAQNEAPYAPFNPETETFVVEEVPEETEWVFVNEPTPEPAPIAEVTEPQVFATPEPEFIVEPVIESAVEPATENGVVIVEDFAWTPEPAEPAQGSTWGEVVVEQPEPAESVSVVEPQPERVYVAPTPAEGSWVIESLSDANTPATTGWINVGEGEQTGGAFEPASTEFEVAADNGAVLAPIDVTADELIGQFDFEPLDGGYASADEAGGFSVPSDDVLETIVWTPEGEIEAQDETGFEPVIDLEDAGWESPVAIAQPEVDVIDPSESVNTQERAPGSTASRSGYLIVPLPGGGVVQMPWPIEDELTRENEPVRWREFSSVPVDSE